MSGNIGAPVRPIEYRATVTTVADHEAPRAIATLVTAFAADPVARWVYPEPAQYLTHFATFVELASGAAFGAGTAFHAATFAGAALWLKPGSKPDEESVGQHIYHSVAESDREQVFAFLTELESHFPNESVWYLPLIGVDPGQQGRGHGSALLEHALKKCDEQHLSAYLEASSERSVRLYQKHGFEVIARVQTGDSPPAWPMFRKAC